MQPKDVLELGKYLVRELGFENSVDTLGRWMAHHLAQLMDTVDQAATEDDRVIAQERTIDTILKIWTHRAILPGKVYPLHMLKDIIPVLKRLQPDNNSNPFSYFGNSPETKREVLAADLFDRLTRLIIVILLMRLPRLDPQDPHEEVTAPMLNKTELYIFRTIRSWADFIIPQESDTDGTPKNKTLAETGIGDLTKIAIDYINSIAATVDSIKANLEGKVDEEDNLPWLKVYLSERPEFSDIEDWEEED